MWCENRYHLDWGLIQKSMDIKNGLYKKWLVFHQNDGVRRIWKSTCQYASQKYGERMLIKDIRRSCGFLKTSIIFLCFIKDSEFFYSVRSPATLCNNSNWAFDVRAHKFWSIMSLNFIESISEIVDPI